ncbi:sigma-54 interaction domain-containing protein [Herbaspirillum rubrisubalbicans]|uniref:Sigma-54-dependent Fis family transcriptional regulator n=1 Tax=Herbaspirillum rubrisubalbicans TaxID=80842 RepID=A0AAD0XGL3_9BURK|nr:sigma-54 dependent transcriptional regulator [Herbaspirillum rubrisubalbicans]ALU89512.1 sigma 54-dependent transcriptional activator [Herbaspirillum rubrisubalbicans M1]AYR24592.1 sigma-54-dependent Fis family transcriptional regulator [Herbaspirillum rubrisubalbicans]
MDDFRRLHMIGSSPQMERVDAQLRKMASVEATVLIEGETGTGKELAARAIHYLGPRRDKPFIPINCGALPEQLIESELFGHERGAFTDAKSAAPGLVADADGGTLFLDEVDALNYKAQTAILRFLQDHTYRRVGSGVTRKANVRIVAATNNRLNALVETGRFRRDLMYRLNVLSINLPPLRERGNDAVEMAQAFLSRFAHQYRMPDRRLHASALDFIAQYDWPGNIRELENMMHREFLMSDTTDIYLGTQRPVQGSADEDVVQFKPMKEKMIHDFERRYVRDVLTRVDGNLTRAAKLAGQERSAFGKLARKHGLSPSGTSSAIDG